MSPHAQYLEPINVGDILSGNMLKQAKRLQWSKANIKCCVTISSININSYRPQWLTRLVELPP